MEILNRTGNSEGERCEFRPSRVDQLLKPLTPMRMTIKPLLTVVAIALLLTPATARAQDEVVYYHTDAIGSVRMITDATGAVVGRYDYLPFGELCPTVPSAPTDARQFAGKERDTETGLDYFGARYFRAQSGRFTSVDPILDSEAASIDPQRWNRYSYARNNPFAFVDPDGRMIWALVDLSLSAKDVHDTYRVWTDANSSSVDKGLMTVGAIAGIALPGSGYGQVLKTLADVPLGAFRSAAEGLRGFLKSGFAENLARLTGGRPADAHAHHMLPLEFSNQFKAVGLNPNDPRFGAWWSAGEHVSKAKEYNQRWSDFLSIRRSPEEMMSFARELAKEYKLTPLF